MKTRTLLLLSVGCGLLILLAGGAKLLQVATDRTEVPVLAFGEEALIGDMAVRVIDITGNSSDNSPDSSSGNGTLVEIAMSGVPGAPVIDDWRLLADGKVFPASGASGDEQYCASATRVPEGGSEVRCVLRFPAAETVQAVAYTRAGEQRQWAP
ncbi:MAG: hypothetical protein RL119_1084 [Actinomycetota bacterium]|jgi:hypothetical protein